MMMTQTQTDLVHEIVSFTRRESYREGVYRLPVGKESSISVSLSSREASTVRQLHRFLWTVIHESHEQIRELTGVDGREKLLATAWSLLEPARFLGGQEGDYEVRLPSGHVVRYELSESDDALLKEYDRLLDRIYTQHHEVLDMESGRGELSTTRVAA